MDFQEYIDKGLLKKQKSNFKQISKQIIRAEKDLHTYNLVINKDPEWASTIAYQAILRTGRALLFAHGYLPADGQQHKTVVEITGKILGEEFSLVVKQFNRLRRKRNLFFYDSEDIGNYTEAKKAFRTARKLLDEIKKEISKLNPQGSFKL